MRLDLSAIFSFLGIALSIVGMKLLYDGIAYSRSDQTMVILFGAMSLALGCALLAIVGRSWWHWKREYRRYRHE